MKNSRATVLAGLALVLGAGAAYHNSLDAPFIFDDGPSILGNKTIRQLWPPWEALSPPADGGGVTGRPLTNLSLAVNYAFGGLEVRGYHVMNLVLHLLATLVLWGVLRRTLGMACVGLPLGGMPLRLSRNVARRLGATSAGPTVQLRLVNVSGLVSFARHAMAPG